MKKTVIFNKVILSTAILLAFASCQKSGQAPKPTSLELEITAGVSSASASKSALNNNAFKVGDKIGVYAAAYYDANTQVDLQEDGNYHDNVLFTATSATRWASTPIVYYPQHDVDIYAYAPYDENFKPTNPSSYALTIPADQSTADKVFAADFMTAQSLGCNQNDVNKVVDLEFHHRFAKLDIHFQIPSQYKTNGFKGVESVTIRNLKNEVLVDLTSEYTYSLEGIEGAGSSPKPAALTQSSTIVDIAPYQVQAGRVGGTPNTAVYPSSDTTKYEMIIAPQTLYTKHNFVEIKLAYSDSNLEPETFTYILDQDLEFKAGQNTQLVLKITSTSDGSTTDALQIILGSITIKDWTYENYSGNTQKMHNMLIDVSDEALNAGLRKDGSSATLTIQGQQYTAIVEYNEAKQQYRLQYDPGNSFGGLLQSLRIVNDNNQVVGGSSNGFSNLNFPIKGDPSSDEYKWVVATFTATAGNAIVLAEGADATTL